jgi:glycerol transport system ATP-binding protein
MARIELVDVGHAYGGAANAGTETRWALRPMTMTWRDGGAYALLGPSGCGKTTLLNLISGLLTPTQGRILFDGKDITQLGPRERNIAQVFQFPVLYDTMTVFDNLAFPLRNRGWKEAAVRTRVSEVAELLDLAGDLKRRARGLPPDAQQKISLGRGLVRTDVAAVLLDEPLTVIDPHLKWLLRRKLKQIHQQLKVSLIYVTHDQHEAFTMSDRIGVMRDGKLIQVGAPREIYEKPATIDVAKFVGAANLLPGKVVSSGVVEISGVKFAAPSSAPMGDGMVMIRPERIHLGAGTQQATIERVTFAGSSLRVALDVSGIKLVAEIPNDESSRNLQENTTTNIDVLPDAVRVLPL